MTGLVFLVKHSADCWQCWWRSFQVPGWRLGLTKDFPAEKPADPPDWSWVWTHLWSGQAEHWLGSQLQATKFKGDSMMVLQWCNCCTQNWGDNKPVSLLAVFFVGVTEPDPFVGVVVVVLSVVVTVTLAAVVVAFRGLAVVFSGDKVTFIDEVVVFGCMVVTFGLGVVLSISTHCSSSCTTIFPSLWL